LESFFFETARADKLCYNPSALVVTTHPTRYAFLFTHAGLPEELELFWDIQLMEKPES
jgi:hypothetical protein